MGRGKGGREEGREEEAEGREAREAKRALVGPGEGRANRCHQGR